MSVFLGGSAYNMVRDVADGFVLVSERTFRSFTSRDIAEFGMEAERLLREVRSEQPALSDIEAIQKRQRRMQRLQQALTMARAAGSRRP
jgi:hypothetical protein